MFALEVELHEPAYLYVLQVDPRGSSMMLYPLAAVGDRDRALGTGVHQIPPVDSEYPVLELDKHTGREVVLIIAATKPLASADLEIFHMVGAVQAGSNPVILAPTPPAQPTQLRPARPPRLGPKQLESVEGLAELEAVLVPELRSRGIVRLDANFPRFTGVAGVDGIVVVPIEFEHEP